MKKILSSFFIFCVGFFYSQGEFITVWQIPSGQTSISFGIGTNGVANYTWETIPAGTNGSGTFNLYQGPVSINSLPDGAQIRLTIESTNLRFFNNSSSSLIELEQWGTAPWRSMANMFFGSSNLVITATDIPDLSNSTNPGMFLDMGNAFRNCTAITTIPNIENWNTSNVNSYHGMFFGTTGFNQDIGSWNAQNVVVSSYMFYGATAFNQDISSWDVSNVIDMSYMFYGATSFNQPLNSWDVSNVTNMKGMFAQNNFNQNIGSWNTSNVTDMSEMFSGNAAFNNPIGNWNTSSCQNLSSMFQSATSFNQPIGTWNTSQVTQIWGMFTNAYAFNQNINSWNLQNVASINDIFNNATAFNQPLNSWNVSNVQYMTRAFLGATAFNQPLNNWSVSNVIDMEGMFNNATSFNQDLSTWNVSTVENMRNLFGTASTFDQDLSAWSLSNLMTGEGMFAYSGLSCTNYSQTLQGWSSNTNTHDFVYFGIQTNMFYNQNGFNARDILINSKGWIINGDSLIGTTCSASIEEFSVIESLYPNPASTELTIQVLKPCILTITDTYGKEIKKIDISETKKIDIRELANGIYFIHSKNYNVRFVKE